MRIDEKVEAIRQKAIQEGRNPVPTSPQGITKDRIRHVLRLIDLETDDVVDAVFAFLDDTTDSWFTTAPDGAKFAHGATTAHLGCHIGILQRGSGKLDREGRDYWIKPLRDVGAVEPRYLDPATHDFIPGHPVAKSNNNCYRLAPDFVELLRLPEPELAAAVKEWISKDRIRQRLRLQAKAGKAAKAQVDTKHPDLIKACISHYVPNFLPDYQVLFVDVEDGVRISTEDTRRLSEAGVALGLDDPMPDVLLWNQSTDSLWVIEAVTSDGEVDQHKVDEVRKWAARYQKTRVGFTTAYTTWKSASARQSQHKNLAPGTYVWILEDASKHFLAESFLHRQQSK